MRSPAPTLYLADTCSLCNADMRAYWEREFFPHTDRKLTILFTVMCELNRGSTHHPTAKAALAFLEEHAEQVILLPEQDGYPASSEADHEIFYHCALRQDRDVVLYTEDKNLASALTRLNPIANIQRMQKGVMTLFPSSWHNVYARLAEKYIIYLTAACVNSPAFAAAMRQPGIAPLFRGKMILSTASLPLLNEQGRATLRALEAQQNAPTLRLQGHICVSETDELIARLLTHSGTPSAMVWLGEKDEVRGFLDMSKMQFAALKHKGYNVAVLKGNGRLYVQQQEPAEPEAARIPAEEAAKEGSTEPDIAAPPPGTKSDAPQENSPAAAPDMNEKEQIRQWMLEGKIKKVGARISQKETLMRHAVNTCFRENIAMLGSLVQSLTQRKRTLPEQCFAAFVSTFLPKAPDELNAYLANKALVTAVKRMIAISAPLTECQTATNTLQKRMKIADEPTRKILQELINSAVKHEAPAPTTDSAPPPPTPTPTKTDASDSLTVSK